MIPVVIFAFNRPNSLNNLLSSLSKCICSEKTAVHIFLDGPRNELDESKVALSKKVIGNYENNFLNVNLVERSNNLGLARSLISGVSSVLSQSDSVIVLEDDLVLSKNFLLYMNCSLNEYRHLSKVGSVSGYTVDIKEDLLEKNYFHPRPCSWGWGTWKQTWDQCDWSYYTNIENDKAFKEMCKYAGEDVYRMYCNQKKGKINSWAILWTIYHLKNNLLCSYPFLSKVDNLGFVDDATHCRGDNPFKTNFINSNNMDFYLSNEAKVNEEIRNKVNWYHSNLFKILVKFEGLFR